MSPRILGSSCFLRSFAHLFLTYILVELVRILETSLVGNKVQKWFSQNEIFWKSIGNFSVWIWAVSLCYSWALADEAILSLGLHLEAWNAISNHY